MKKLLLILFIGLISFTGYSQATSTDEFRIADATTAFGKNLPVGTKVYDINTGNYWVATAGVASASTLTTASGSFTQLNGGAAAQDLSLGATGATTQAIDISGGGDSVTLIEANTNDAGLLGAAKWDEIVANTAKATNVSTNLSEGTTTNTTVDVNSSDGTNATLAAASTSRAGVMTKAKFDEVGVNNAKVSNVSTNLSLGTRAATTMDVNSSDGTNVTLLAANTTEAGLMTEAQFDKLAAISAGAEVNLTSITEDFEEDDGTATAHSLSQTAVTAQGARVSINGATLKPGDYTFATGTITIGVPVLQYDQVVITYFY